MSLLEDTASSKVIADKSTIVGRPAAVGADMPANGTANGKEYSENF